MKSTFDRTIERITNEATEASLEEIGKQMAASPLLASSVAEPVAQEAVTQADRDLLALRAVMPVHPSPSPEQGEDDLVQRLKDAVTDTFEHDAEGDGYYDTPLTFLVREAATAISALRARVAELEARATPPDSDAVRAERERCAKLAARLLKGYDNGDDGFGVEEAIRSGRAAK